MQIRFPQVAGSFYPNDPKELSVMVDNFLDQADRSSINGKLRALICPHAGYIFSGPVAAYAYKILTNIGQAEKKQIILIGPSHFVPFEGASVSLVDFWETPLGKVKVLKDLGQSLISEFIINLPSAHLREHSLETQVPFLQKTLKNFAILPIVAGEINYSDLAKSIEYILTDQSILIISSDLSHYYPYNQACSLDALANSAIPNLDIDKVEQQVQACGKTGILTLMHLSIKFGWQGKLLKYKNSGDTFGDKSQVVGYGAYGFFD